MLAATLGQLWTRTRGLRSGDRFSMAPRRFRGLRSRRFNEAGVRLAHRNTWDLEGALAKAFSEVGGRAARRDRQGAGDIGEQHGGSGMYGLSVFAGVAAKAQDWAIADVEAAMHSGEIKALYAVNAYDGAPLMCQFGALATQIMPHARLLHLNDKKQWRLLTRSQYEQVFTHAMPRVGVVEIVAQQATVLGAS